MTYRVLLVTQCWVAIIQRGSEKEAIDRARYYVRAEQYHKSFNIVALKSEAQQ